MNMKTNFLALIAASLIAIPAFAVEKISGSLKNAEGKEVGTVQLTQLKHGVRIVLDVNGLTPGEHAFHVHEKGSCAAPDFKSAGSHFSVGNKKHGFDVADGPHHGDMPNLVADDSGRARLEVINPHVTLGKGKNSLLREGGTSIVVHAKADDYKSQPAGDAGDRVACAEIKK